MQAFKATLETKGGGGGPTSKRAPPLQEKGKEKVGVWVQGLKSRWGGKPSGAHSRKRTVSALGVEPIHAGLAIYVLRAPRNGESSKPIPANLQYRPNFHGPFAAAYQRNLHHSE